MWHVVVFGLFLRFFFYVSRRRDLRTFIRRWVQVVAVAFSYGAEEVVGQTNVCARRKRLNFQGVCTVRETTVDLQVHALLFFQCVYFCSIFTCFGTLIDEGVVAVAFSYGAEEAVGQTNVCARRKRLNFQGVCTLQVHALLFSNVFVFVPFSRALVR